MYGDGRKEILGGSLAASLVDVDSRGLSGQRRGQRYNLLPGSGWYTDSPLPMQGIPEAAVKSELQYLSQNPVFASTPINVNLYDQQVYRISEGYKVPYRRNVFRRQHLYFCGLLAA